MKKTTIFPILALAIAVATMLTAFSVETPKAKDPKVTFEEFLQQFPAQSLPYALDENSIKARLEAYVAERKTGSYIRQSDVNKSLSWKYLEFLPELEAAANFSRDPMRIEPVAMFATANNRAVLYSTSRSHQSGYATYGLVVFNKKGAQISSNTVGSVRPETIVSSIISTELQAQLKTWRIDWTKDYSSHGMEDNEIKGLSHVESEYIDLMQPTTKNPYRSDRTRPIPKKHQTTKPSLDIKTK